MVRPARIGEAGRLEAVDSFRQVSVEERVLDIQLVNRPSARRSKLEDGTDRRRLDHRGECLMEVDTRPLREAADDPSGLATFQGPIGMELVLEYPFASDDVGVRRLGYKGPGAVRLKGIELGLHCRAPLRVSESGADS